MSIQRDTSFQEALDLAIERVAIEMDISQAQLLAGLEFIDGDLITDCQAFQTIMSYMDVWTCEYVAAGLTDRCNHL